MKPGITAAARTLGPALLLGASVAACGPRIVVDQSPSTALPGPATYAWQTPPEPGKTLPGEDNPRVNNDIMHAHLKEALDVGLARRGYRPVAMEQAAWLLHYHVGLQKKQETVTEPLMMPPPRFCSSRRGCAYDYYWGWYGPPEVTRTITYNEGSLMVDIHDAKTQKLVWRGIVTDEVNINKPLDTAALQKAVNKMLEKLPAAGAITP